MMAEAKAIQDKKRTRPEFGGEAAAQRHFGRAGTRFSAVVVLILMLGTLIIPIWHTKAYAAGGSLEVRVKYFGDPGNKIRTKKIFTESELRGLGTEEWLYSNVTSVGTVLSIRAEGPRVLSIIEAAGIDLNSVNRVNFRAGDDYGYSMDFMVGAHLSGGRYYYPNLNLCYERNGDGTGLTPVPIETEEGVLHPLEGGYEVPAILALRYGSTKQKGKPAGDLTLKTEDIYRFCMGQKPLQENVSTRSGEGGDATSMESIKKIHGIDVTLYGSPVDEIMMDISSTRLKVGSRKKISVVFSGDELFSDVLASFAGRLKWKSSDPSVVRVDQQGNINVLKKGTATITVTAANGMEASVTINATGEPQASAGGKTAGKAKDSEPKTGKESSTKKNTSSRKNKSNNNNSNSAVSGKAGDTSRTKESRPLTTAAMTPAKRTVRVREISIGQQVVSEVSPQDQIRQSMAQDAEAMGKLREYGKGTAAGTAGGAVLVAGAGALLRIRRFRRDIL